MILTILFILLTGALLELISLRRDQSKLEYSFSTSAARVEPGEVFTADTTMVNHHLLPITYMDVRETFPAAVQFPEGLQAGESEQHANTVVVSNVFRMGGRQRIRRSLPISIEKRGKHLFFDAEAEVGDFLGFTQMEFHYPNYDEVLVYPRRLQSRPLTDALGSFCGEMQAQQFLIRDPILTIGVRDYTGHEPMRDIHWTQTARKGSLMVREFDYNRQLSASVILSISEVSPAEPDRMDLCCSVARTVCETLTDQGVEIDFYTNGRVGRNAAAIWSCKVTPEKKGSLLEGLSILTGFAGCSTDHLLQMVSRENNMDTAYIVISSELDTKAAAAVAMIHKRTGVETMHLLAEDWKEEA